MSIPSTGAADFSMRFKLVDALPAAMVIAVTGGLLLSGAPQRAPSFDTLAKHIARYEWFGAVAAVAILLIGALLLEPLEISSLRLLEGYWSKTGLLARLGAAGVWHQKCQRDRQHFIGMSKTQREQRWPEARQILPTALGNRMRAFELRGGDAYGWQDILRVWPRLYNVLPEATLAVVNGSRNQLDVACRLCLSMLLTAAISFGLLVRHNWWLVLPLGILLGAWVSYRAALAAAVNYGIGVRAAVDVHRVELYRAMGLQMPLDIEEERKINEKLWGLWGGSPVTGLAYDDPAGRRSDPPHLYPG